MDGQKEREQAAKEVVWNGAVMTRVMAASELISVLPPKAADCLMAILFDRLGVETGEKTVEIKVPADDPRLTRFQAAVEGRPQSGAL